MRPSSTSSQYLNLGKLFVSKEGAVFPAAFIKPEYYTQGIEQLS
jgi:hypothetical protein